MIADLHMLLQKSIFFVIIYVSSGGIFMKDVILYHGSRGGLDGDIRPCSRIKCDFGKGFYMGENPMQVKSLVVEDVAPVFYTLKLKLSEIPEEKILNLENDDWLYAILANRKKIPEFNQLEISKFWIKELQKYDVVIGKIADDRMNVAMQRFAEYGLTNEGLIACLQSVDYGNQVVAKTPFACSKIEILSERDIFGKEAEETRKYTVQKREESKYIVQDIAKKYQRKGLYLNEMIDKLKTPTETISIERSGNDYERN